LPVSRVAAHVERDGNDRAARGWTTGERGPGWPGAVAHADQYRRHVCPSELANRESPRTWPARLFQGSAAAVAARPRDLLWRRTGDRCIGVPRQHGSVHLPAPEHERRPLAGGPECGPQGGEV